MQSTIENVGEQSLPNTAASVGLPPREEQSSTPGENLADSQPTTERNHFADQATWADWDPSELPDYNEHIFCKPEPDSDEQESDALKLSAMTKKIVEDAFGRSMPNERCRGLKRQQPTPDTPHTKCPKLDPAIQSRPPKTAKDTDRNLARLQTLVLDTAAPFLAH